MSIHATTHPADNDVATAVAGAATCHHFSSTVTSEALTTAAGADYVLTLTNRHAVLGRVPLASVTTGTNTTVGLSVLSVTMGAGTVTVRVRNVHASAALNGTIVISVIIF